MRVITSAPDAVDGSSTGTSVPWMWALLRLPRFRGASHADDHNNRFGYRQVGLSASWSWWLRPGGHPPLIEATLGPGVLPELPPCLVGIEACGPYRATDAAGLREALRQASEERCS